MKYTVEHIEQVYITYNTFKGEKKIPILRWLWIVTGDSETLDDNVVCNEQKSWACCHKHSDCINLQQKTDYYRFLTKNTFKFSREEEYVEFRLRWT